MIKCKKFIVLQLFFLLFMISGCKNDKDEDVIKSDLTFPQLGYYIEQNSVCEVKYHSLADYYTCVYIKKDSIDKCKENSDKFNDLRFSPDYSIIDGKLLYQMDYLNNKENLNDVVLYKEYKNFSDIPLTLDSYELGAIFKKCIKTFVRDAKGELINKDINYYIQSIATINNSSLIDNGASLDLINKSFLIRKTNLDFKDEYPILNHIWYTGNINNWGEIVDNYLISKQDESLFQGLEYQIKDGLIYFNLDFMIK